MKNPEKTSFQGTFFHIQSYLLRSISLLRNIILTPQSARLWNIFKDSISDHRSIE